MTRRSESPCQVLTANRLRDGAVVYAVPGGWSADFADAEILPSPEAAAARLREAEADRRAGLVVEPYLLDVAEAGGAWRPLGMREMIRARRAPCIAMMSSTPAL